MAQRRRRRNRVLVVLFAAGAVVALVLNSTGRHGSNQRLRAELTAGGCRFDQRSDPGRAHVTDATYTINPPSGGDHDPVPAASGAYTAASTPTDPRLVHSLEHGYVIVWHRPDLAVADEQHLAALAARFSRDILVVPRSSLPTSVAATAWHERLLCSSADDPAVARFVETYRNKGPERIPH